MQITVHDEILTGNLPNMHGHTYVEAGIQLAQQLTTAYEDYLHVKYPDALVNVKIEVKMLGGFTRGLEVDIESVPGSLGNDAEILYAFLESVRERTCQAWLEQKMRQEG